MGRQVRRHAVTEVEIASGNIETWVVRRHAATIAFVVVAVCMLQDGHTSLLAETARWPSVFGCHVPL